MTEEPNLFSEAMAWFCCALMAMMLFAIAAGMVVCAIVLVKTFGALALAGLLVVGAMTYGIRRYAW